MEEKINDHEEFINQQKDEILALNSTIKQL